MLVKLNNTSPGWGGSGGKCSAQDLNKLGNTKHVHIYAHIRFQAIHHFARLVCVNVGRYVRKGGDVVVVQPENAEMSTKCIV